MIDSDIRLIAAVRRVCREQDGVLGERLRLRPHDGVGGDARNRQSNAVDDPVDDHVLDLGIDRSGIDGRRCQQLGQLFFPLQDVAGRRHADGVVLHRLSPRWLRLPSTMTTGAPRLSLSEKSDVIMGECGYRSRQIRGHAT